MATDNNGNYLPPNAPRFSGTAVLASVVALVAVTIAAIVGLVIFSGSDSRSTPVIVTLLGFVAPTVTGLLALLRVDQTRRELHNGLIPAKVHEAVQEGVKSGTLMVKVDRSGMRERSTDTEGKSNG